MNLQLKEIKTHSKVGGVLLGAVLGLQVGGGAGGGAVLAAEGGGAVPLVGGVLCEEGQARLRGGSLFKIQTRSVSQSVRDEMEKPRSLSSFIKMLRDSQFTSHSSIVVTKLSLVFNFGSFVDRPDVFLHPPL